MSLGTYLKSVLYNGEYVEWSIRDGMIYFDKYLRHGDSILLDTTDQEAWPARRVTIYPGNVGTIYFHQEMFKPLEERIPVETPKAPMRAPLTPREQALASTLQRIAELVMEVPMDAPNQFIPLSHLEQSVKQLVTSEKRLRTVLRRLLDARVSGTVKDQAKAEQMSEAVLTEFFEAQKEASSALKS